MTLARYAPRERPAGSSSRRPARPARAIPKLDHTTVLQLQRSAGNRLVNRLLSCENSSIVNESRAARAMVQRSPLGDLFERIGDAATVLTGGLTWAVEAAGKGPALATVRLQIKLGNSDENDLTNTVFYLIHPELPWKMKLRPAENPDHVALVEEWIGLRDRVVRPELKRAPPVTTETDEVTPAADTTPSTPTPSKAPGGKPKSREFLKEHKALFDKIQGTNEDELLFALDAFMKEGSQLRLEYHAYNYTVPTPLPLTHQLFKRRRSGVDPLTNLIGKDGKRYAALIDSWDAVAAGAGGWDSVGVTVEQWAEIKKIRDEIVYPLARIVLPRIEGPDGGSATASVGEKIAHRAHTYLGVRYELGGDYHGTDPDAKNPFGETGARLDCSAFVRRVFKDLNLKWARGKIKDGSDVPVIRDSEDMIAITVSSASDLKPGDLLFRSKHVGIYVGGGKLIQAPHRGRVVSKDDFVMKNKKGEPAWDEFRRYVPPP